MILRLWCDEDQIEIVKRLSSCESVVTTSWGDYYIVAGDSNLEADIDNNLEETKQ